MRNAFLILSGVTVLTTLAAAGTFVMRPNEPALAASGERLFPALEAQVDEIARVTVRDSAGEMVIERRDGQFTDAASGFPVAPEVLRRLVSAIALAEIAEAKTTDPARHADLYLAAPDAGEGAGTEIHLIDAEGETLAHLVAGARDGSLGGIAGGQYLRRGGEDATWLARARIDPPAGRAGWFETVLHDGTVDQINSIRLFPVGAEPVTVTRVDGVLQVSSPLPEGRIGKETALTRLARLFSALDFENVRPAQDAAFEGPEIVADLESGMSIRLSTLPDAAGEEEGRRWVRIEVTGESEAAKALRERISGFDFALRAADDELLD